MPQAGFRIEVQHFNYAKVLHMGIHYRHLTEVDRVNIDTMLMAGHSQRQIAKSLGFSASTISREIRRACVKGCRRYFSVFGQRARSAGRQRAGLARRKLGLNTSTRLWRVVIAGLRRGHSPQQVAGRLRIMNATQLVSHETIYCAIYAQPRGTLRTELIKLLRKSKAGRRIRGRVARQFTGIQNITPIDLRPPEVAARVVPGHWEGDLIKGARNASAVGTIVERTSRYVMLVKLDNSSSGCVLDGFTQRLRRAPASLRKTMTYDRGTEMALHETLAKRLRMDIYICDPHSPWQRGSNENANGLIREYLPKGMDLSCVTQAQLTAIEKSLNTRPRQILGFRTPAEVFADLKLDNIAGVALQA
jgi:IS30 family transposase